MENNTTFDPLAWVNIESGNDGQQTVRQVTNQPATADTSSDDQEKILAVGQELLRMGANIAESYSDWLRLGFALADGLGSGGRELYHQLSAMSTKYNEAQCEKKWQQCLARGNGRTTVKTFYFMAQQAGVDLSEIGRRFPSNPHFPQPEGEELKYIGIVLSEDSLNFPQGEGSEGSEGNSL